ncbi:MAG: ribosome-recycling factor, partial [Eubacteriales bacterium]|nr:ribosome-recycling factor [Eubacteriales bacterium]
IHTPELGINPQNDSKTIRINFPPLTEERRKELVKDVHKKCENAKVIIRNIRRDAMDHFKAAKKNNEITEDDLKDVEKDIQTLTDAKCKEVDTITAAKEKEIMEI